MPKITKVDTSGFPVGTIIASQALYTSPPFGFLHLDGSTGLSKTTYAKLYAVLQGQVSEGATTFNLPDLRGYFVRGLDTRVPPTVDPDKAARSGGLASGLNIKLGSTQTDAFFGHRHLIAVDNGTNTPLTSAAQSFNKNGSIQGAGDSEYEGSTSGAVEPDVGYSSLTGGSETRPKNFATNYFIAYI